MARGGKPSRRGGGGKKRGSVSKGRRSGGGASLERWERDDDIPMDGLEEFNAKRDRILETGAADLSTDDEEEVFALDGVGSDSDSDLGADDQAADDDADEDATAPSKTDKKSKSKKSKKEGKKSKKSKTDEDEDDEDESWGSKKSAYYAEDVPDEDDEEAEELHTAEARRVQMKARAALTEDDFGMNDLRLDDGPTEDLSQEELSGPVFELDATKDPATIRAQLAQTYPETLALAREWEDNLIALDKAEKAVQQVRSANPDALSLGLVHVHHQTLLTYTTMLAFYFHLCSRSSPATVRAHPVLKRLLTLKQALSTMEELDFAPDSDASELTEDDDSDGSIAESEDEDEDMDDLDDDVDWRKQLDALVRDAKEHGDESVKAKRTKKATAAAEVSKVSKKTTPPSQVAKAKKPTKKTKEPKIVFDLVQPEFVSAKAGASSKTKSKKANGDDSAFGDPTALSTSDASDKARRKKSLKFHASRIESAADRRVAARSGVAVGGGDEDVPYPERKREAEKRRAEEVERRRKKEGLGQGGADLDDEEPDKSVEAKKGKKRARDEEDEEGSSDGEGYYDLVASRGKEVKKAKREAYEADRAAERYNPDNEDEQNGPRALTRAILKNKGLTPHRSKSVRNPRVKKRMRYEKAKKKVSSQKAIYKGGSGEAINYSGERSGISKVIKSTKLS